MPGHALVTKVKRWEDLEITIALVTVTYGVVDNEAALTIVRKGQLMGTVSLHSISSVNDDRTTRANAPNQCEHCSTPNLAYEFSFIGLDIADVLQEGDLLVSS